MPFLLVIGAAYACYSKNDGDNDKAIRACSAIKIDRTINLRGKSVLDLHTLEKELSMTELPISVLSNFSGNYTNVAAHIEQRVNEIITLNPWLAGVLLPMPDVKLVYDKTSKDRSPGIFRVYKPGSIDLRYDSPYSSYTHLLKDVLVGSNTDLIGQNKPLWKVSVIPDASTPLSRFALVVSMSHAIGDAHTFYAIFNMLSATQPVQCLNARRVSNYVETVHRTLGATEVNFVHTLTHHHHSGRSAVAMTPSTKSPFDTTCSFDLSDSLDNSVSRVEEECNAPESKSSLISSLIQHQTETHAHKNVMKLFCVDEAWIAQQKDQHNTDASAATISTNSIVSSWFVGINQASVGVLMVNLRHRLSSLLQKNDCCLLTDIDAGNYAHAIVGHGNTDFKTPEHVQDLVRRLGRVELNKAKDDVLVDTPTDDEFQADHTTSLCVNWTSFYRHELVLSDTCVAQRHLPIYDTEILQYLPEQLSAVNLFTVKCGDDSSRHRIGAFVVCQEDVWRIVEASGIVSEMI